MEREGHDSCNGRTDGRAGAGGGAAQARCARAAAAAGSGARTARAASRTLARTRGPESSGTVFRRSDDLSKLSFRHPKGRIFPLKHYVKLN